MRKYILDIPIDWIPPEELSGKLISLVRNSHSNQITTVNPEFIVISAEDERFKKVLQNSDLSVPDGTGIVIAQTYLDEGYSKLRLIRTLKFIILVIRYLFTPYHFHYKRITGVELTDTLLQLSQKYRWGIFLLGAKPGIAQQAAEVWRKTYPGVNIVGVSSADPDDEHIIREIRQAAPQILLVAYGAPKQEYFIVDHAAQLKIPIMVGIGGTFDYAAGVIHRPPIIARAIGLEWLIRFFQQPKRIKRIYRATVVFSYQILRHKASKP